MDRFFKDQIVESDGRHIKKIAELKVFWEIRHKDLKRQLYQTADDVKFCVPMDNFNQVQV